MAAATRLERDGGVCWIDVDDGKVNALSSALLGEIDAALDEVEKDGTVAVIRGRPGIFSAGFHLGTIQQGGEAMRGMLRAGAELVLRLLAFPRPVLTVCTGHAYPAGAFLMLSADSRLGVSGDWKIGLNEVAIGLTLPRFAVELARHRLVPAGFAQTITGRLMPPEEAAALGYLDRVCAPEELEAAARAEAARLCALDLPSFEGTKRRVNAAVLAAVREGMEAEIPAS